MPRHAPTEKSLRNLIPMASRTKEERLAIARKGGEARQTQKVWSNLVRIWEKEKKITPQTAEDIKLMLRGRKTAALRTLKLIEKSVKIGDEKKAALLLKAIEVIHGKVTPDNQINIQNNSNEAITVNFIVNDGNNSTIIEEAESSTGDTSGQKDD
jgi:hypothetical protein